MRILVVTAVAAERDAILGATPGLEVVAGGIGPAAAAAATSAALATSSYDLVVCAGIAGGFAPVPVGGIAVASTIVFADLGAETGADSAPTGGADSAPTGGADGDPGSGTASRAAARAAAFLPLGTTRYPVAPRLAVELADCTGGHLGSILTVSTVTGSASTAAALRGRHPDAVAEAMEGAGVAAAATLHGVAFAEVRAISNAVGPRDRAAWRIPEALAALAHALAGVAALNVPIGSPAD